MLNKIVHHFEEYVAGVLMIILLFILAMQIVSRQILSDPLLWSEELARLLFVYMVMFGAASAIKRNLHVKISFFSDMLPKKGALLLEVVLDLVVLLMLAYLANRGLVIAENQSFMDLITLDISAQWLYAALPLGCILMAIRLVQKLVNDIQRLVVGSQPALVTGDA